jgi:hypothetical protein
MSKRNSIIFVPGIRPKPPAEQHRQALWECLIEGVRRANPAVAQSLAACSDQFQLVPWSKLFYGAYRDIQLDREGIRHVLEQSRPTEEDLRDARSFGMQLNRLVYIIGDRFPGLMKLISNRAMATRLDETRRYFKDVDGIGTKVRQMTAEFLLRAWQDNDRVMLIGHSFGAVIAYDTLWELSRSSREPGEVDMLVTMGSPMGLNFMRKRVRGAGHTGPARFPANIRHWLNISALGEPAALDRKFVERYREMLELGLVDSITGHMGLVNVFRDSDGLNVHKCYGYFVSRDTGRFIADWWQDLESET